MRSLDAPIQRTVSGTFRPVVAVGSAEVIGDILGRLRFIG